MNYDDAIKLLKNDITKEDRRDLISFLLRERARENPIEPIVDDAGSKRLYCPECEHVVGARYKYCSNCGQKMDMRYI